MAWIQSVSQKRWVTVFCFRVLLSSFIIILHHHESSTINYQSWIIISTLPCLLSPFWKTQHHFPSGSFWSSFFFLGVELSTVCSRERRRSTRRTVGDFCPMPSMARLLRCRYFFPAAVGDVANGAGFACTVFSRCFNLLILCFLVWGSACGFFYDEDLEWRSVAQSHVSMYYVLHLQIFHKLKPFGTPHLSSTFPTGFLPK